MSAYAPESCAPDNGGPAPVITSDMQHVQFAFMQRLDMERDAAKAEGRPFVITVDLTGGIGDDISPEEARQRLRMAYEAKPDAVVIRTCGPGGDSYTSSTIHAEILRLKAEHGVFTVAEITDTVTQGKHRGQAFPGAFSANYHIAAAADAVTLINDRISVGSIGTLAEAYDVGGNLRKEGIQRLYFLAADSRFKRAGAPDFLSWVQSDDFVRWLQHNGRLTNDKGERLDGPALQEKIEAARQQAQADHELILEQRQRGANAAGEEFVQDVVRARGGRIADALVRDEKSFAATATDATTPAAGRIRLIDKIFGAWPSFKGRDALDAGLADHIGTAEDVLARRFGQKPRMVALEATFSEVARHVLAHLAAFRYEMARCEARAAAGELGAGVTPPEPANDRGPAAQAVQPAA